jgi:hypothetical protein
MWTPRFRSSVLRFNRFQTVAQELPVSALLCEGLLRNTFIVSAFCNKEKIP